MANLNSGTFLRLYGGDARGVVAALEVPITAITLPTGLGAAIDALGAATYGAALPSNLAYIGYDVEVIQDGGASGANRAGDVRDNWRTSWNVDAERPDIVSIPGRDFESPSLLLNGTIDQIDSANSVWTAWIAAMGDSHLNAPLGGSGAGVFAGGVAGVYKRVRPRERVRVIPNPILPGGTVLHLWGMDTQKRKRYMKTYMKAVVLDTALVTAINALGAATFGSVPGPGPIKPSLLEYEGFSVLKRVDNGYTGAGSGDVRSVWRVTSKTVAGHLVRFTIPGRNPNTADLYLTGTRTIANFNGTTWQAWETAMADTHITAPLEPITADAALLVGARATVRVYRAPRETVE